MEKGGMIDADTAKAAFEGFTPEMVDETNKQISRLKYLQKSFKEGFEKATDMGEKEKFKNALRNVENDINEKEAMIATIVTKNVPGPGGAKVGDKVEKQATDLSETVDKVATTAAKGTNADVANEVNVAPSTSAVTSIFGKLGFDPSLLVDFFSEDMSKEKRAELKSALDKIDNTNRQTATNITGNNGQLTATDVEATRSAVTQANTAAQIITKNKQYKGLTRGQAIMGITFILSIAGLGGYIVYNDIATNDAIDKLTKTILGLNKQNTDGCFLITNSDYIRLDDDCSTWYSTGDNKFSCGCGTLTDTKQTPDCSALKDNDRDCTAPYCLGQTTCTNPIDPAKTTKCTRKDKPDEPLPQCTGKDLDDPNFISYAYSDSLPLEPLVSSYTINKEIYDKYYNSSQDKTLMYVSIGISALSLLVLVFFIVRYYMRKK